MEDEIYLGVDFGTSGARAIAISKSGHIQEQFSIRFANEQKNLLALWKETLFKLLSQFSGAIRGRIRAIAINGTSSTVLLCDQDGQPLTEPILYNDDRGAAVLEAVRAIAPENHTVVGTTSSLAKLLWWKSQGLLNTNARTGQCYFLHQADWLAFLLHGRIGVTDYHNALKLGYDVEAMCYPDWLLALDLPVVLPQVLAPGDAIAPVSVAIAQQFGLPSSCQIHAGTTDSIAAFLASRVKAPGEAVTSLGSTLVLKLLSRQRVDDARYGIYSHRLGDLWLVGGASNTGGAVLKQFFSNEELVRLSAQISAEQPTPLDYYPLLKPGERFPINDPNLLPRLEPRPANDVEFLHGLLEGIARIETRGYQLLQELGASPLTRVFTAGGGAENECWMRVRSRLLGVPVVRSVQTEAAYGTALLAAGQIRREHSSTTLL